MNGLTDWFKRKRELSDAIDTKVSFDLGNPMTAAQSGGNAAGNAANSAIDRTLFDAYKVAVDNQVRLIRAQFEASKMAAKHMPIEIVLPVDITPEMRESILREYVRNTGKYGDVAAEDIRVHVDFIPKATIEFTAKEVGFVLADLKLRGLEPGDAE